MEKTSKLMDLNPVIGEDIRVDESGTDNWHTFKLLHATTASFRARWDDGKGGDVILNSKYSKDPARHVFWRDDNGLLHYQFVREPEK